MTFDYKKACKALYQPPRLPVVNADALRDRVQ